MFQLCYVGDPGLLEVAAHAHHKKCVTFFWEGEKSISLKAKNEHQPCYLKYVLEEIPLAIAAGRPQTAIMTNPMNSAPFGWKTVKDIITCFQERCCSFTRQPTPFESVLHECQGELWDVLLLEMLLLFTHPHPALVFISGAETSV